MDSLEVFDWLLTFSFLSLIVFAFLWSFLSKDPGRRSISVALFCYLYFWLSPEPASSYIFLAGLLFSVIYMLILTAIQVLKWMGLRKG